jgi:hypothetical protein
MKRGRFSAPTFFVKLKKYFGAIEKSKKTTPNNSAQIISNKFKHLVFYE